MKTGYKIALGIGGALALIYVFMPDMWSGRSRFNNWMSRNSDKTKTEPKRIEPIK